MSSKRPLNIDELNANHYTVSVHKYGFFLCTEGKARILLGSNTYLISRNYLCLYAPNMFFQILEKSFDLKGILEEDSVETYYPVISSIDIRKRLLVRNSPCLQIPQTQAHDIIRLYDVLRKNEKDAYVTETDHDNQDNFTEILHSNSTCHLRYALCMKVLETYFRNKPEAMCQSKDDVILNRFLVSVYENCKKQRSVQYYANEQNLSPYYFSSIIREKSGKSALQWIDNITMIFSRQYLKCSDMSIKEIADCLNFPDQSSFARYFKHHEGCSPMEFRNRRLQD